MPDSRAHLSDWTLEQLAEGMLSGQEHQNAAAHLQTCPRCAAELDACRSLFTALAELPRFAPSPVFADEVIARIHPGHGPSPVLAQVRRWLPVTKRGWMLLAAAIVAPALPLIALLVWLLTQPMVSATSLLQWGSRRGADAASAAIHTVLRWETVLGIDRLISAFYSAVAGLPLGILLATAVMVALGIPLSVWSLVRLVRKPIGDVHYAN